MSGQQKTPHSINSSASESSDGGTVRPSARAVLRLITSHIWSALVPVGMDCGLDTGRYHSQAKSDQRPKIMIRIAFRQPFARCLGDTSPPKRSKPCG
jgi:hypothetical protein